MARVWRAHETRFGTVLEVATRKHPDPNSTLLLDGKTIFEALGNYLHFNRLFSLGGTDALLFGAGPGGSASGPDQLFLVLLSDEQAPVTLTDPRFESGDWTLEARVESQSVIFDLGFQNGKRKYAELVDGKLSFRYEQPRVGVLATDCAGLFRMAAEHCLDRRAGCEHVAPSSAISELSFITRVSQQPGFSEARLTALCRDACSSDQLTAPDVFIREVCGYAAPDPEVARAIETAMHNGKR